MCERVGKTPFAKLLTVLPPPKREVLEPMLECLPNKVIVSGLRCSKRKVDKDHHSAKQETGHSGLSELIRAASCPVSTEINPCQWGNPPIVARGFAFYVEAGGDSHRSVPATRSRRMRFPDVIFRQLGSTPTSALSRRFHGLGSIQVGGSKAATLGM